MHRYSLREQSLAWRLLVMFIVLAAILAVVLEVTAGNPPKAHAGSGDVNQYSNQMRLLENGAHCREPQMRVNGGNVVFPIVIKATLSWRFCWDHNSWLDAGTNALNKSQYVSAGWAKEGISLAGSGQGTNPAGIKYKYRRYDFDYGRSLLGIPDHKTLWISITVRANGTCTFDKFGQDGNISCDQAAGGGGGGSW